MNNGNGIPDAMKPAPEIKPEDVARVNAQRMAMAAAARHQMRQGLAGIILNGICSGLYSNTEVLPEGFGDRAVRDAVQFADKLLAELEKPQQQPQPPGGDQQPHAPA